MSNIYVACGGSLVASGIYEGNLQNDTFLKVDDPFFYGIYLTNSNTTWDLIDGNGYSSVLYRLSTTVNSSLPVSATSWTSISGISPPIQTYEFVTGNTEISILVSDAWSPVNGTYVWSNSISIGGGVGTVSGYYKGSGANLIAIYWATNMWKIVNSAGTVLYNGDFQSTSTTPPVSNYSGTEEYWTGVGSLTETPTSRVSVTCTGGEVTPSYSGYFVHTKNNIYNIRKLAAPTYAEPTECPDGIYPDGWYCCPGGGAASNAMYCGVPGPNYMSSPATNNFFIRKQQ